MSLKRIVARNVAWNTAGLAAGMAAGFLVAPFLVHQLGQTGYGLWVLITSMTGYFGVFDLGMRGSVGRHIAFCHAQDDRREINVTLNTALLCLCGIAVLILAATVALGVVFFHLFEVPAEHVASTRLALLIVGANLALSFPFKAFDATLWGTQRFDVLNSVDIPVVILRTVLTFLLIHDGDGLVKLALITVGATMLEGFAKFLWCLRVVPGLRLSAMLITRNSIRTIGTFGIWQFLLDVSLTFSGQMSVLIIGVWASVEMVTSYSVGSRLVSYACSLLIACSGVLTPIATAFEAVQEHDRQRLLFIRGGQVCMLFALYCLGTFLFLGKSLITVWMGPALAGASVWLIVIACGQVLPMSQWVTHGLVLGKGRHRFMACMGVLENAVAAGVAIALVGRYGVLAVCLAYAVCATLSRGVVQMVYGCRLASVPVRSYVGQVFLLPVAAAVPPFACLAVLNAWHPPTSWPGVFAQGMVFTACCAATAGALFTPRARWAALTSLLLRRPERDAEDSSIFRSTCNS